MIIKFSDSQRLKLQSELESNTLKLDILKSKESSLNDAIENEQNKISDKIKSTMDEFKPATTTDAIAENAIQKSMIEIQIYDRKLEHLDSSVNINENVIWSKLGKLLKPIPNIALWNVLNRHTTEQIERITLLAGINCSNINEDDTSFSDATIKAYAKHVKIGVELESVKRSTETYTQQFCNSYNDFSNVVQMKMQMFDPNNYDDEVIKGIF